MNPELAMQGDFELMEEVAEPKQEKEEVKIETLKKENTDNASVTVSKDQVAVDGLHKINQIGRELGMQVLEREAEIRSLMLGLAARKHVLLLGPPGTGKSNLTELFSKHIIDANYFQWLLNRTSDPSELLGPISIQAMENDRFIRKPEGKLPEAHFAFVDEVFKSNSATLNILLPLMNEGIWYNDGKAQPTNLKLLIGASNEFPED